MRSACLLIAVIALTACHRPGTQETMAEMGRPDTAVAQLGAVHLSVEQARAIGVAFTVVRRGPLVRTLRTVGQVVPAEPNLGDVTTKIDGFVDELFVNATGSVVRRGQPLLTLYSPMLVAAQEELLTAKRLDSAAHTNESAALLEASRRRLAYWDISADQIERLERTGEVTKTLRLNAPFDGVVLEKMVVQGQSVTAGMKLYRLASLATLWIEGAVFEQDLGAVRLGAPVTAEFAAYPGRTFNGHVSFVWPMVDSTSRSGRVRVAFDNPRGELRPGMYATLRLEALVSRDAVQVPADAVVQTGERDLVFVVTARGALEPREVTLGQRAGDRFQIVTGLESGERFVTAANFLVDAESRLGASGGMAAMPGMNMSAEKRP